MKWKSRLFLRIDIRLVNQKAEANEGTARGIDGFMMDALLFLARQ
jgi:hypothetical protein